MTSYTNIFGDTPIQPAVQSYRAITLAASTTLAWPYMDADSSDITADIMEVSASTTSLLLGMPPADEVSVGMGVTIRNVGSNSFTVTDNSGNTIIAIGAGLVYAVYVKDNSSTDGVWGNFQLAAATSSSDASTLAGDGLTASGLTLNTVAPFIVVNSNTNVTIAHRSRALQWTGGTGTLTFTSSFGGRNGAYVYFRNDGTGTLTLSATSINSGTSVELDPSETAMVASDTTGNLYLLARYDIFHLITTANFVTATSSTLTLSTVTPGTQAYEITNAANSAITAQLPTPQNIYAARYVPVSSGTPNYTITFSSSEGFPVTMVPGQEKLYVGGSTQPRDPADFTQREPSQNWAFFGDFSNNPWSTGTSFTSNSATAVALCDRWTSNIVTTASSTSVTYARQTSSDAGFKYDMRVTRANGSTGVTSIKMYGVLTGSESAELQGKRPMVVARFKPGSTNFTSVAAYYLYRTGTSGDNNPITGTDWITDTGGPYITSLLTADYNTYAYRGANAIASTATQVAIAFAITCTGTATASDLINIDYIGMHDGDIFSDFSRLNPALAGFAANTSLYMLTASGVQNTLTLTASGLVTGGGDLSTSRTFLVTVATQTQMETPTSTAVAVTPQILQYHPGVAKSVVRMNVTGTTVSNVFQYNGTVARTATGVYAVTFTTAFADTSYAFFASFDNTTAFSVAQTFGTVPTTTSCSFTFLTSTGVATDPVRASFSFFGDQ